MLLGDGLGLCKIVFSQKRKKEKKKGLCQPTNYLLRIIIRPFYINFIGRGRWILGRGHCNYYYYCYYYNYYFFNFE